MWCKDAQRALSLGSRDAETNAAVAKHVAQCPACQNFAQASERLDVLLSLDEDAPPRPGFDTRFFARLDALRHRPVPRRRRWLWAGVVATAGLVAVWWGLLPTRIDTRPKAADLEVAMELDLLEELEMARRLDEVEEFEILAQVDLEELHRLQKDKRP